MTRKTLLAHITDPRNVAGVLLGLAPLLLLIIIMAHHQSNLPRLDTIGYSQTIAIKTANGTLTFADLFNRPARHPMVTMDITTIIVTWFTPWNVDIARWVSVAMGGLTVAMLGVLGAYTHGRTDARFLLPTSAVFFSLGNIFIPAMYDGISYYYPLLFGFAAFVLILTLPRGVGAFVAAAVSGVLAVFSLTNGLLVWGLVLFGMAYKGYRRWPYYVAWGGLVAASFWLLYAMGILTPYDDGTGGMVWSQAFTLHRFVPIMLGRPFVGGRFLDEPHLVGTVGLIVFAVNVAYLAWQREWRAFWVWFTIGGYALLIAVMIGLSFSFDGIYTALLVRYISFSAIFWAALFGTGTHICIMAEDAARPAARGLAALNLLLLAILTALFVPASYRLYHNPENQLKDMNETCHMRYFYTRDFDALAADWCIMRGGDYMDALSENELALFATLEPQALVPAPLPDAARVVVSTHHPRVNDAIEKWLLDGVPASQIWHISPDNPTLSDAQLASLADDTPVWYLYQPDYHPHDVQAAFSEGRVAVETDASPAESVMFRVVEWAVPPDNVRDDVAVSEYLTLTGVHISGDITACEPITVQTAWQIREPYPDPIGLSATLTIETADGEALVRDDGQLSRLPSNAWDADGVYLDSRTVTLPCERAGEAAALRFGVYDWRDGARLPVFIDGEPAGDLIPLDALNE